jgi:hypothetical protein
MTLTPIQRLVEVEAERDALRTVVEWYADENNYGDQGDPGEWIVLEPDLERIVAEDEWEADGGERARAALHKQGVSNER